MREYTDAEKEQHRIELADALIDNADRQIAGFYSNDSGGVCAVGCAIYHTSFQETTGEAISYHTAFKEYFGLDHDAIVMLNETLVFKKLAEGIMSEEYAVNLTFPQIADVIKNA